MTTKNQKSSEYVTVIGAGKVDFTETGSVKNFVLTVTNTRKRGNNGFKEFIIAQKCCGELFSRFWKKNGDSGQANRKAQLMATLINKFPVRFPTLKLKAKPRTEEYVIKKPKDEGNGEE
ncbi:hypothetical protein L2E82_02187 [Cichorium intybus]|uniref:Uncharacterized protein n=1 Tax=Cichorium intybus TaxID=13427 RepID=A0ACB9H145_CICIN|nr:hypothetical protein L2E82_02187 [Cichorium intybus]